MWLEAFGFIILSADNLPLCVKGIFWAPDGVQNFCRPCNWVFFSFFFFYQMWAFVVCHQLASVFLLFVFELESLCVFKAGWPYYDCFCVHFVYTLFCLHLSLCAHHLQTGAELFYLKLIKLSGQFHQAQIIVCCKAQLLFLFLLTPIYF